VANIPYPRTDRTSVQIRAAAAFVASEVCTGVDVRDYPGGCVFWLLPTTLGTVTSVELSVITSDDGATISPASASAALVKSDDGISAGAFDGNPYTMTLSGASLVAGQPVGPFRISQVAGFLHLKVVANGTGGSWSARAQRFS
jgi:hypothetical protein